MEKIIGNLTSDSYYNDVAPEFVDPPTKEAIALAKQKEANYLLAKKEQNYFQEMKKKMPYVPKDKAVYDSIVQRIDDFDKQLSETEDLENSLMDIGQFSNDLAYKHNAYELTNRAAQFSAANQTIDDAVKAGKIVGPDLINFYKNRIVNEDRGFIENPETGQLIANPVPAARFNDYFDVEKYYDDISKDWKANKYVKALPNGKFAVSDEIAGYFGTISEEGVTDQEIAAAIGKSIQSNSQAQGFLDDEAEMMAAKYAPTAESIKAVLTPNQLTTVFGKSITEGEIQEQIDKGFLDPQGLLKQVIKNNNINNRLAVPISKNSYIKQDLTLTKDWLLEDTLKTVRAGNRGGAGSGDDLPLNTVDVSILDFTTSQIVSPRDVAKINTSMTALKEELKVLDADRQSYEKQLKAGTKGLDAAGLRAFEDRRKKIDEDYEILVRQKENIAESYKQVALGKGFNVSKRYNDNKAAIAENNEIRNLSILNGSYEGSASPNVDITTLLEKKKDGYYIDNKKVLTLNKEVIYLAGNKKEHVTIPLTEKDGKIYYNHKKIGAPDYRQTPLQQALLNELGEIKTGVHVYGNNGINKGYSFPTEKEYEQAALDYSVVREGDADYDKNSMGILARADQQYIADNITGSAEIENLNTTRDFHSLLVNGTTTKSSLKAYNNYENSLQEQFAISPEKYKIGDLSLPDYLEETYAIDNIKAFIDMSKSKIYPLLERDRSTGQNYGFSIVFKDSALKDNPVLAEAYGTSNSIKLVGVDGAANANTENAKVQSLILNSLQDLEASSPNNPFDEIVIEEAGRWFINADNNGRKLDNLNVYTLPPGEEVTWAVDFRGQKENVIIKAIDKNVNSNSPKDIDFRTYITKDNIRYGMAVNVQTGETELQPVDTINKNKNIYEEVVFDSPEDIKKKYGGELLRKAYENKRTAFYNNQNSDVVAKPNNDYQISNYNQTINNIRNSYPTAQQVTINNNSTGKPEVINSYVPASDLVNVGDLIDSSKIWKDNRYPYINKAIQQPFQNLVNNYGLLNTGGFRGTDTHPGLGEDKSAHMYGFGTDFDYNEKGKKMYNDLTSNPALMKQYGIARIIDEGNHYHVTFVNPGI